MAKRKVPHKGEAAKPGVGGSMRNTRSITTTEKVKKEKVGCGLPHTYFGNSRVIGTE